MNIFLVGSSGLLGRHVLRALLEDGRVSKIYCLIHNTSINLAYPAAHNILEPDIRRKEEEKIIKIKGCVENLAEVRLNAKIDQCLILSGIINGMHADEQTIMRVNYKGVLSAVEFCKINGIGRICVTSSVNVKLKQHGAYAKSKCLAERAVRQSGLKYLIFRPALIYGADADKGLKIIEKCIRKYGIVPVFGSGERREQPIWVGECAAFIAYYLLKDSSNRIIELYGREAMTYNQMCRLIAEAEGRKIYLIHIPVWIAVFVVRVLEKLQIRFPVSQEQIYHIDTDLDGNMEQIYKESGIYGDTFVNNLNKLR